MFVDDQTNTANIFDKIEGICGDLWGFAGCNKYSTYFPYVYMYYQSLYFRVKLNPDWCMEFMP